MSSIYNLTDQTFFLKGHSSFKSTISDYEVVAKDNHAIIDLIQSRNEGIAYIPADTHKQYMSFHIKKEFLEDNFKENQQLETIFNFFENKNDIKELSNKKINLKTFSIVHEIINMPYKNGLEQLYFESKCLELFYTELNELINNKDRKNKNIKLSNQDKEAIYYAREILSKNIKEPPSIKKLSRMVALNELKLKTGFHCFFNGTPYNISLEYRLNKAKKLLENSDMNINEITSEVGYKYAQNFSKAFSKRFGILSKELMKSRTYYY